MQSSPRGWGWIGRYDQSWSIVSVFPAWDWSLTVRLVNLTWEPSHKLGLIVGPWTGRLLPAIFLAWGGLIAMGFGDGDQRRVFPAREGLI